MKACIPSFFDILVRLCARRGWWRAAEGVSYHTKGDHLVARIKWRSPKGNSYYLSPVSYIDRLLLSETLHDAEVIDFLRQFVNPTDVVWDVGANIGFISLETAAICPEALYYCFEPSPMTASQLVCNAIANQLHMHIFTVALSDRDQCHPLFVKAMGNAGQTCLNPTSLTTYDCVVNVATMRADTLINQGLARPPTILKIDTEGHEARVLDGLGEHLLSDCLRCVVFEKCPEIVSGADNIFQKLVGLGFKIRELPGSRGNWAAEREN